MTYFKFIKFFKTGTLHQTEIVSANVSFVGHAGSVVSDPDGRVEAASDAWSDGIALAG